MGEHGEELVLAAIGVPQSLVRSLTVRDLAVAASQTEILALLPEDGLADLRQPADCAVPVDDAELELDARGGGHERPRLLLEPGTVLLVNEALQQVRGRHEIRGLVPADPLARRG